MSEFKKLDQQGILLFNLEDLTRQRSRLGLEKTKFVDESSINSDTHYTNESKSFANIKGLPNICLIDSKDPDTFINLLQSDMSKSDVLLKMSTFELSSLVPLIRIFKVYVNPFTSKEAIIEIPFETKATGIDDIFNNGIGRGTGAGITSVEWKINPKNEAQTTTFRVSLNLHLQNIEEFFKDRSSFLTEDNEILTTQIQDLLYQRRDWREQTNQGTSIFDPEQFTLKMIVGWQISDEGLESIRNNRSTYGAQELIDALKDQKYVLYLTPVTHTFEFSEDGSVDLQINFIGRADSDLFDPVSSNVLNLGTAFENTIKGIKKQIKDLEVQSSSQTDSEREDENKKLKEELENIQQISQKALYNYFFIRMVQKKYIHQFRYEEEILETLSNLRGNLDLTELFEEKSIKNYIDEQNKIKQKKYELDQEDINNPQVKANPADLTAEQFNITTDLQNTSNQALFSEFYAKVVKDQINTNMEPQDLKNSKVSRERFILNSFSEEETRDLSEQFFNVIIGDDLHKKYDIEVGRKIIPFFYLSSLLEVVMEPLMNENNTEANFINKKTRLILGPMTIYDYGTLSDSGRVYKIFKSIESKSDDQENEKPEIQYAKVYEGKKTIINIGDIPISLTSFASWFNTNIINKNKTSMTLNDFLLSLLNDLVVDSLENQVYPNAPKQKIKPLTKSFRSIAGLKNELVFMRNISPPQNNTINNSANFLNLNNAGLGNSIYGSIGTAGGYRIDQAALETLKTKWYDIDADKDPTSENYLPAKNYVVIYCGSERPTIRTGDYYEDLKQGILHLNAGDSKGTIKTLKFSRIDNARLRTENVLSNTVEGKSKSKILRENYNAVLDLFGNVSFEAGSQIHLTPYYGGIQSVVKTAQLLKELGLGGYYLITEVHHSIKPGEFNTTLRTTWTAFGDGTYNDGSKQYIPADEVDVNTITKGVVL